MAVVPHPHGTKISKFALLYKPTGLYVNSVREILTDPCSNSLECVQLYDSPDTIRKGIMKQYRANKKRGSKNFDLADFVIVGITCKVTTIYSVEQ